MSCLLDYTALNAPFMTSCGAHLSSNVLLSHTRTQASVFHFPESPRNRSLRTARAAEHPQPQRKPKPKTMPASAGVTCIHIHPLMSRSG